MTEERFKLLCKLAIENSNHPLTDLQKEALKQVIDQAKTPEEIAAKLISLMTSF